MTRFLAFDFCVLFVSIVLVFASLILVDAQSSTTLSNSSTTTTSSSTTNASTTTTPTTTTPTSTSSTTTTSSSTTNASTTATPTTTASVTNTSTTTTATSSTTTLPTVSSTTVTNATFTTTAAPTSTASYTNTTSFPSNTTTATTTTTTTTTGGATTPAPPSSNSTSTPTTAASPSNTTTTTTTARPTNATVQPTNSTATTTVFVPTTFTPQASTAKPSTTTTRPRVTRTKTFVLTTTPRPLVQPVAAIESTALSITTSFASVASGAAAAQTLRSMSILGVMYTKERCGILSNAASRNNDAFGSSDRTFPESFLPFLKIPSSGGGNSDDKNLYDVERNFGLASRRGAIVANTFIAPILVLGMSLLLGLIRTKTSKDFAELGILAGGRTPSIVPAVIGALLVDGTFCSGIVLLTVPGGPLNGGDVALAIFGILVSLAIVVIPGVLFWREVAKSSSSASPIECVPSVVRSEQDPEGSSATGIYYAIFGTEVWNGDRATVEKYQVLFSSCRGMSHLYESSLPRRKQIRRWMSMWSFYLDVGLTATAAAGRAWATTEPCAADRNVQIMQFVLSLVAFIYCCVIRPQISPMRRLGEIFSNLLLVLSSFVMAVLGSESSELVVKCSWTAAFIASCTAIFVVVAKPAVGAIEGKLIVPDRHALVKPKPDDILEELLLHHINNINRTDGDVLGEILSDPSFAPIRRATKQKTDDVTHLNNNNNNNNRTDQEMDRFFETGPEENTANNNTNNNEDEIDLELILAQLSK